MQMTSLIDRNFISVSILEDTRDAAIFLRDHDYMAIIDEDNCIVGILTRRDLFEQPDCRNILDCKIEKQAISLYDTIFEVIRIMCESKNDFLPVFREGNFIGVISLLNINYGLIVTKECTENDRLF